jgi:hypothetical protein
MHLAENRTFSYQQIHAKRQQITEVRKQKTDNGHQEITQIAIVSQNAGKPLGELPIMSIENPTLAPFRHFRSLFTNFPSTTVESSLQIDPFMQNKANW